MKAIMKDVLLSCFMGLILPSVVVHGAVFLRQNRQEPPPQTVPTQPSYVGNIHVAVRSGEEVQMRELEDYITEVVLSEMPASFEPEALKAQAVAARTYTMKAALTGGKHGDGSTCTDSACCQAHISKSAYLLKGGTEEAYAKVRSAVVGTAGQVLTYGGELIEATYFSCSGGRTEDAVQVWGADYPYLVSVESPGEEAAAHYRDTVTFTPEEFAAALDRELEGTVKDWFEGIQYTHAGSVSTATICGQDYTGTQLRSLLGLRSTAFSVETKENTITITTKGYGHRVGLSQYGADAMAVQGSDYREILAHYYTGTVLGEVVEADDGYAVKINP